MPALQWQSSMANNTKFSRRLEHAHTRRLSTLTLKSTWHWYTHSQHLFPLQQIPGNAFTEQNVFLHVVGQWKACDFTDPMPHGAANAAATQVLQGGHETGTLLVHLLLALPLLAVTAPGVGQVQAHGVLKPGLPTQNLLEGREVGKGVHHSLQEWAGFVFAAHFTGKNVQQCVGDAQFHEERRHLLIALHPVLRPSCITVHHHIQRRLVWDKKVKTFE